MEGAKLMNREFNVCITGLDEILDKLHGFIRTCDMPGRIWT